jgi:glycosyltransferase involved in cell wall biosynthesis
MSGASTRHGIRVLMVVERLFDGGQTRSVLDLAAALADRGIGVEVFALGSSDPSSVPHGHDGLGITEGSPPGWRLRYATPVMVARLARAAHRADVVLGGAERGLAVGSALLAARIARRPVLAIVRGDPTKRAYLEGRWVRRFTRWAYPRFDVAVCNSAGLVPAAAAMGVPRRRVRVISSGLDLERVRKLGARPAPNWLPEPPLVVALGRLAEEKAYDVLLRAHARVRASGLEHNLVIVGEGPERQALETLAAELDVSDTVLMPGFIANPLPVVASASLFCFPSRSEGWGRALAEALALGVPVVAADCVSGPAEILEDGRYGSLVPVDSVPALEAAIAGHLRAPELLAAKAKAGHEHARSFSVAARAETYEGVFEEMLSAAHRQRCGRALRVPELTRGS